MAETTVESTPSEQSPETPEKRAPGRPRSERAAKADKGEGDVGESFFDSLKALTEQDWKDLYTVYLYRCEPYTDRKVTGNDNFIMKYTQPIDQQSVMEEYGSGKYLAVLNVFNPQSRHSKSAYSHYFRIMNMNYPPKLPLGEWINDGRNKDWAWAKPLLEQAEAKRLQQMQTQGTTAGMDQAAQMFGAAVEAVQKLRPNDPPEEQNALAVQVISSMEKSADRLLQMMLSMNKPGGDSAVLTLVSAQLSGLQEQLLEEKKYSRGLLEKILTPPVAEPRRSLKEELGDVKEISTMFRSGGAAAGTDWAGVAVQMGSKLLDVGGAIAAAIISKSGAKPTARPQPTINTSPVLAPPAASEPSPASADVPSNLTPEQQMYSQLEQINNQLGWLFDMVTPYLVEHFHKSDGVLFRDWFLDEHGEFAYRQIKLMSPETIIGIFELRKQVAPDNVKQQLIQLQPVEKVQRFVTEFLSDEPAEEEDDDDQEKPGAPGESRALGGKDF